MIQGGSTRIKGSEGIDVAQDPVSGELQAELLGSEDLPIKQKAVTGELQADLNGSEGLPIRQKAITGELLAELNGSEGLPIKQKATTGELIAELVGSTGNPVAQDANDALECVMKGNYAGALQTWKVDSEGRGEMFLNDSLDVWGNINTIGLADHAVRVGSPVAFDRRGHVYFIDSFEHAPLKWVEAVSGGFNYSSSLSNEQAFNGDGCLKVVSTNVNNGYILLSRSVGGLALNKIGIEAKMRLENNVYQGVVLFMQVSTGSRQLYSSVCLRDSGSGGLSYLSGSNKTALSNYTTFDDTQILNTDVYFPLKFVIDCNTEKYVRCMFGGNEIDMSPYSIYGINSTAAQHIWLNLMVITVGTTNHTFYFDDVIVTMEEPA